MESQKNFWKFSEGTLGGILRKYKKKHLRRIPLATSVKHTGEYPAGIPEGTFG